MRNKVRTRAVAGPTAASVGNTSARHTGHVGRASTHLRTCAKGTALQGYSTHLLQLVMNATHARFAPIPSNAGTAERVATRR